MHSWAPNSRAISDGPIDDEWAKVLEEIKEWDAVWFGNGIKETAVFRKPDELRSSR
jgi:protein gp37